MVLLARLVLERAGHYVEHVADGQAAWDRIMADPAFFEVVITDHQMPRLTGLQLVQRLRAAGFRGRILVHSSHLTADEEQTYLALDVEAILHKPTSIRQLLEYLERPDPQP